MWVAAPTLQVGVSGGIWGLSRLGFRPNARFHGGSCERKGEGTHVAALETGGASGSFLKGRGGALQVQEWVG